MTIPLYSVRSMANFPSPTQIIEELNDNNSFIDPLSPHPRQGEVEAAKYIYDLAQKFSLGNAHIVPLPRTPTFDPYTKVEPALSNVVIDVGEGTEEILFFHGHFDVVPPKDYHGKSHDIVRRPDGELRGLGSYDMLPGVAAILTALRGIQVAKHRRIRAILVCGEENDSEGTHAAFDRTKNLFNFAGRRAALSTEITVGATINDPYHLVVGRPGRYTYDLLLEGLMRHSGEADIEDLDKMTLQRLAAADRAAANSALKFPKHPNDTDKLFDKNARIALEHAHTAKPGSLSTPGDGEARFNVHYANPSLTAADIQLMIHESIKEALGDEHFILGKTERTVPWLRPWLERVDEGSFARSVQSIASKVVSERSRKQQYVQFRAGKGVADENIISQHGIPIMCIPPQGEGAHKEVERSNVNSVTEFQTPVLQAAAAYDGVLCPEQEEA